MEDFFNTINNSADNGQPASHKKWFWFKLALIIIGLIVVAFAGSVGYYFYQIKTGKMPPASAQQEIDQEAAINKVAETDIITLDDPYQGHPDAKVRIVEFSEFQCPYSRQAAPIMQNLVKKYGDKIMLMHRDFPLNDVHAEAQKAAEAGECAQDQGKFWELNELIFKNQEKISVEDIKNYAVQAGIKDIDFFNKCLDSGRYAQEVKKDLYDGVQAGVAGTPTFFINGIKAQGVIGEEDWGKLIDSLLK